MVAQMGLNINYSAIDYMLETMEMINLVYYLLLMLNYYLSKIDAARRNNLLTISSKNNNIHFAFNNINKCVNIQSAENCKGFSETIRQLSNSSYIEFYSWLAGIIDGDGNFDIRKNESHKKLVLKAIRIKLHNRDVRILTRIQNYLNKGARLYRKLLLCLQLSNSGNTLKLMVPSDNREIIRGRINYTLCVVIRHMIWETKIGYRGSKLVVSIAIVKEQRINGSRHETLVNLLAHRSILCLRCILMDFAINYQGRLLSKQINIEKKKIIFFLISSTCRKI